MFNVGVAKVIEGYAMACRNDYLRLIISKIANAKSGVNFTPLFAYYV